MSDEPYPRDPNVAALLVEVRYLRESIKDLKDKIDSTDKKVSDMQILVNKYRGGLAVILGAGALLGWVLSNLSAGAKLWGH